MVAEAAREDLSVAVVGTAETPQVLSGPVPTSIIPPSPASSSLAQKPENRLQRLEDSILERSLNTVSAALYWEDIQQGDTEPPQSWVEELGEEGAKRRFTVAKAAWESAKTAPVGLGMARATAMGITKVRALSKVQTPTLNINFVNFQAPPALEIIDVESE